MDISENQQLPSKTWIIYNLNETDIDINFYPRYCVDILRACWPGSGVTVIRCEASGVMLSVFVSRPTERGCSHVRTNISPKTRSPVTTPRLADNCFTLRKLRVSDGWH